MPCNCHDAVGVDQTSPHQDTVSIQPQTVQPTTLHGCPFCGRCPCCGQPLPRRVWRNWDDYYPNYPYPNLTWI